MKTSTFYQLVKHRILATVLSLLTFEALAQSPEVQWQHYYFPGYHKTNATFPLTTLPTGFDPTKEDYSGQDWTYDVKPVYENGQQIGYIGAGFSTFVNNGSSDGCIENGPLGAPFCSDFETSTYRGGNLYPKLYFVDMAGNVKWYKNYGEEGAKSGSSGRFYSVIPLEDGGYMAVGIINWVEGIRYNPNGANSDGYIYPCTSNGVAKIYVVKVDANGNLLYQFLYGYRDNVNGDSYDLQALGFDLIQTNNTAPSNQKSVVICGRTFDPNDVVGTTTEPGQKAFLVEIDPEDGLVQNKKIIGQTDKGSVARAIAKNANGDLYISGRQFSSEMVDPLNAGSITGYLLVQKMNKTNLSVIETELITNNEIR
jgi:hypothetical protein